MGAGHEGQYEEGGHEGGEGSGAAGKVGKVVVSEEGGKGRCLKRWLLYPSPARARVANPHLHLQQDPPPLSPLFYPFQLCPQLPLSLQVCLSLGCLIPTVTLYFVL